MKKLMIFKAQLIILLFSILFFACNSSNNEPLNNLKEDTLQANSKDSILVQKTQSDSIKTDTIANKTTSLKPVEKPKILIYNFHVTNRCASCIAIEEATTKTLNTYFTNEVKQGQIKRQILNVDDEANAKIAEKYQAFGSAIFTTRVFKGKEITTDFTGDGFKYAKNKEDKYIEILKNKITEYLKQ